MERGQEGDEFDVQVHLAAGSQGHTGVIRIKPREGPSIEGQQTLEPGDVEIQTQLAVRDVRRSSGLGAQEDRLASRPCPFARQIDPVALKPVVAGGQMVGNPGSPSSHGPPLKDRPSPD